MANTKELQKYNTEYDEAKKNFLYYFKPEFDRAYKLFSSYNGDRAAELEQTNDGEIWQSNVFVPQVFSYIKTFLQKTVGITPDFKLEGKNSEALKDLILWLWDIGMSDDLIDYFLQVFICGTTIGKDFLKRETKKKRKKEITLVEKIKKLVFKTETAKITFRPDFDPVDIYNFYPHPRMKKISDPFPVFHRYVLTLDEMKAQYPDVPASTWNQFVDKDGEVIKSGGDTTDLAYVRKEVLLQLKKNIRETTKASSPIEGNPNNPVQMPTPSDKLFEIVERWTDDHLCVFLPMDGTPVEVKSSDNPYDHQQKPYSRTGFFPRPFSFYWLGIPKLVEHLQELLNSITNQRVDAVTMKIHSMIAAAPVALPGYKQSTITVKPLGILWTNDPNSVKELKFGDVNSSAFVEPDHIKEAMRIAVGIDEYTTTAGRDQKQTATVASFMREATLEGVKLFLIMLRNSYVMHFDHWISMVKQFWTTKGVMPDKAVAILMRHGLITKDSENIEGLFDDEYEMSLESTSSLATSSELRKAKDLELWGLLKDVNELTDAETGTVYSVRKFKVLMKIFEDYGWEPNNYVSETKVTPPVADPNNPNPVEPGSVPAGDAPDPEAPPVEPLAGNQMGSMFGNAMKS
ncbi:MAG: hypothetical protein RLZZ347_3 [Candidatus Parcubacteria bacterium]|jgi:hypothetical protein